MSYISAQLAQAIVDEIEAERDSILVVVPKMQAFKTSAAVVQTLTEMYEMDGVMACADRPPRFIKKVLGKHGGRTERVHFIELVAGDDRMRPVGGDDVVHCPVYDLERFMEMANEGLQRVAEIHGGEDHFTMFDDVSALRYYHNPKALQRFFEIYSEHMEEIGVLHVAVIAKEEEGILARWPMSAFQARINVKPAWLMAGGPVSLRK